MTITKRKAIPSGNGFVLIRGTIILPDITKEEVFRAIYDVPIRTKWDSILSEIKVIEKIRETCDIVYCSIKVRVFIFLIKGVLFLMKKYIRLRWVPHHGILFRNDHT
jgi:hypothetical protein